mgnify:CR=1 FL=1
MRRNSCLVMVITLVLLLGMNVATVLAADSGYPVLITSGGQGPDGLIVKVLLEKEVQDKGIEIPYVQSALPEDIKGVNTLLVAVGVSSKGLGAAGINLSDEMSRVESLLQAANEQGSYVVLIHSGGSGRRGASTDGMMTSIISYADEVVVLQAGNEDGFFTKLGTTAGKPVTVVNTRNELGVVIRDILEGKQEGD